MGGEWTGPQSVNVKDGLFTVDLGSIQPLAPTIFDRDDLYLGVKVESDIEMLPRQKFTNGAYSFSSAHKQIQQIEDGGYPTITGDVTNNFFSTTVPAGEEWKTHFVWAQHDHNINDSYDDAILTAYRFNVDGVEQTAPLNGGAANGFTAFFSPLLKIQSGQTISFDIALIRGRPGAARVGIYYYKIDRNLIVW